MAADSARRTFPAGRPHLKACEGFVMNVRAATQTIPLDRAEADALAHASHGDPFRLLGPHDTPVGPVVRALLPGAAAVEVLRRSDRTRLGRLEPVEPHGLFEGLVSDRSPYLLHITWPGATQETEDPYSFGPLLGDID